MTRNKWVATFAIVTLWSIGQNAFAEAVASDTHEKQTHENHTHDTPQPDVKHNHHEKLGVATLKLNAGNKWVTDAPLRGAMANIHQTMAAALDKIHHGTLNDAMYDALAATTQQEVANMVSQCKLPPDADAQLHLVIAELLLGADALAGKHSKLSREQGAAKVMDALKNYSTFFADDNPVWSVESRQP
jgi:hypothetical protein